MKTEWELELTYKRWVDGTLQSWCNLLHNEKGQGHCGKCDLTKEDLLRLDDTIDDIKTDLRLTAPTEEGNK